MRLEIEVDYECDEDEARAIAHAAPRGTSAVRQITQNIFGHTGLVVQGVEVFDSGDPDVDGAY